MAFARCMHCHLNPKPPLDCGETAVISSILNTATQPQAMNPEYGNEHHLILKDMLPGVRLLI